MGARMKQETIERFRDGHRCLDWPWCKNGCAACEIVDKDKADILAVLEAAQRWAEAELEWEFLADKGDGMPEDVLQRATDARRALLALFEEGI